MFKLELKSKKSIYEQIIDGYKEMIIRGELKPDDKLLSVRDLSEQLTVNPNTVQKAYKALEQQGWIYSSPGLGSFISERENTGPDEKQVTAICKQIQPLIRELGYQGLSKDDIRTKLEEILESTDAGKGGNKE